MTHDQTVIAARASLVTTAFAHATLGKPSPRHWRCMACHGLTLLTKGVCDHCGAWRKS